MTGHAGPRATNAVQVGDQIRISRTLLRDLSRVGDERLEVLVEVTGVRVEADGTKSVLLTTVDEGPR